MRSHATLPGELFYVGHQIGDGLVAGHVYGPYSRRYLADVAADRLRRRWPDHSENVIIVRSTTVWTLAPKEAS